MNQILENRKDNLENKKRFSIQFYIYVFIVICIIAYFSWKKLSENNISKTSDATNKSYNITRLYSNKINTNITANKNDITIIGFIEIPKINISYPIISKCSDELLKISVCKFYGPNVNTIGNLCITGHNYNNEKFFSNLYQVQINDIINIYDINSNIVSYYVYGIFEVEPDNLEHISQETKRKKRNNFNYM